MRDFHCAAGRSPGEDYLRTTPGLPAIDIEMTAHMIFTLAWEAGRMLLSEPEIFSRPRLLAFARTIVTEHFDTPRAAD